VLNTKLFFLIYIVASLFFFISLIVHFLTFIHVNVEERVPFIWILHVGFLLLAAAIAILHKLEEKEADSVLTTLMSPPVGEAKNEDSNIPKGVVAAYFILAAYVLINFVLFISAVGLKGSPMVQDGKYVISNHGTVVKELTKSEYDEARSRLLRGSSGHWLLFYFYIACVALYSSKNRNG
jgi:amino acid transporter